MPFFKASAVFILLICYVMLVACHQEYDDAKDWAYENAAEKMYLDGNKLAAVKFLDSVYASGNVSILGRYFIYSKKTRYYYDINEMVTCALYADSSIKVLRDGHAERRYVNEYSHALLEKGHVLDKLGNYDSAYKSYMEGYSFVVTTGSKSAISEYDYFIGMVLFKANNMLRARIFFTRSFEEAKSCAEVDKPYYRMQELLDNIALTYPADSSIVYYDSCISFIEHNSNKFHSKEMKLKALVACYKNKSVVLLNLDKFDEAEEFVHKTIGIRRMLSKDPYDADLLDMDINLALIYYYRGDRDKLNKLWREADPLIGASHNEPVKKDWVRITYIYHAINHDYKKAYEESVKCFEEVQNERNVFVDNSHKDVLQDMKNKEQAYKIQLLTQKAQLQRVYLQVATGLTFVAVLIIFLVFNNYKRTRQKNVLINEQKIALEASNKEKDRILNVVAHDLRNPIGNVVYVSDMMLIPDGSSIATDEAFQMIKDSSLGSLNLVNELLSVTKNYKGTLKRERLNINEVVVNTVAAFKYKAAEKKQRLVTSLPDTPVYVSIDKEQIERVFGNLISNAIKFSEEDKEIGLIVQETQNHVAIQVKDGGIGIPAALLPGLFEIFTESSRRGTANEQSYGLGLSISKQIIDAHKGTLTVVSTEEVGTTFTIILPV